MLCLKLTCLILLKYHMQYVIVKKCRFFMSCVCFCFAKHFENTTHFLVNNFEFEQFFPMRVQTFGPIGQHCIMYIHFAIFRNFHANLLHFIGESVLSPSDIRTVTKRVIPLRIVTKACISNCRMYVFLCLACTPHTKKHSRDAQSSNANNYNAGKRVCHPRHPELRCRNCPGHPRRRDHAAQHLLALRARAVAGCGPRRPPQGE